MNFELSPNVTGAFFIDKLNLFSTHSYNIRIRPGTFRLPLANNRQQGATGATATGATATGATATGQPTHVAGIWQKGKAPASCIYAPYALIKWKVRVASSFPCTVGQIGRAT